ncbi:phosphoenolpyruvate hydrolase family protein [Castellaniella sp.]|uniref:phosphoenolpyruvate hydrolase family protein n=1 Tax=Castellaniella sp. TaxID=1955812 RepID=UPI00356A2C6B
MHHSGTPESKAATPSARATLRERFSQARRQNEFLVGAAIGAGLLGEAAEDGGADFLIALNAGRFRLMGTSSVACLLPIRDANAFVMSFAPTELLSQCTLPVFFGASVMDPTLKISDFCARIAESGFAGIANFPSAVHYPAAVRDVLQASGIGFARELELFDQAHREGLATLAYVRTREQAQAAAAQGVDLICYNFGWNAGGNKGPISDISMEEAAAHSRDMGRTIRRENPDAFFFLEGGPIQDPEQLAAVCRVSNLHGYVGGSTIDRLPLAQSVTSQTQRFKSAAVMARRLSRQQKMLVAFGEQHGFTGRSQAMLQVYAKLHRPGHPGTSMLVSGEPNTGRSTAIMALHTLAGEDPGTLAIIDAHADSPASQILIHLFGRGPSTGNTALPGLAHRQDVRAIVLRGLGHVPLRVQERLANSLRKRRFTPVGARHPQAWDKRLIFVSEDDLDTLKRRQAIAPPLARMLEGHEIRLPPLRERTEDLEDILHHFFRLLRGDHATTPVLAPGALGLLQRHDWPGNLLELRSMAVRLLADHAGDQVDEGAMTRLLVGDSPWQPRPVRTERDVVLNALWRHGFHRQETANFLGISRKTLYNKIRRYHLTSQR